MNTELYTVSRIFTESLYRIPDYQRGYSWREEHLKDFWLDLEQIQGDSKHYTGVLTLEEVPVEKWSAWEDDAWIIKSRRYKPYYLVDGQQRLTTVIILLQCILEHSRVKQLNYTPTQDIRRKYIYDSKPTDISRSYIFGYERDNPSYEFLKRKIFCEKSDQHAPDEETIYTKNLIGAKEFFLSELSKINKSEIELLFTKVTQQLVFNVYEISSDIDVFVAFETMNNRGKPLSTLELLKNRLIFLSTKIASQEENGTNLRRAINDAWKTAYHYLGKNDERPLGDDEFLRTHLSIYYPTELSKIPENSHDSFEKEIRLYAYAIEQFNKFLLNDLFTPKRLAKPKDNKIGLPLLTRKFIYDYAQDLKTSVELFFKLSTPEQSTYSEAEKIHLERIGRLRGFSPPNLLVAIYKKEDNPTVRVQLLHSFERLLFCQSLTSRTGYGYVAIIGNPYARRALPPDFYLKYISEKMSAAELTTQFNNIVDEVFKETPLHETLYEWVKNGPSYYGWRSIKYFLFEYELSLQDKNRSGRQKIDWREFSSENFKDDYETIEHIYPQRARDKYWTDRFSKFSSTQKRLIRNSLGNLLPLSKPRNSSLGNKSFIDKLGDEKNMTGYRFGSYSENEVAQSDEWGPNDIVERGLKLIDFLEKRWGVSAGDRNQKMRALGLEFLK